jgi:hypothetical protein
MTLVHLPKDVLALIFMYATEMPELESRASESESEEAIMTPDPPEDKNQIQKTRGMKLLQLASVCKRFRDVMKGNAFLVEAILVVCEICGFCSSGAISPLGQNLRYVLYQLSLWR